MVTKVLRTLENQALRTLETLRCLTPVASERTFLEGSRSRLGSLLVVVHNFFWLYSPTLLV